MHAPVAHWSQPCTPHGTWSDNKTRLYKWYHLAWSPHQGRFSCNKGATWSRQVRRKTSSWHYSHPLGMWKVSGLGRHCHWHIGKVLSSQSWRGRWCYRSNSSWKKNAKVHCYSTRLLLRALGLRNSLLNKSSWPGFLQHSQRSPCSNNCKQKGNYTSLRALMHYHPVLQCNRFSQRFCHRVRHNYKKNAIHNFFILRYQIYLG